MKQALYSQGRFRYLITCKIAGCSRVFQVTTELPGEDLALAQFRRWIKSRRADGELRGRITDITMEEAA